MLKSERQAKILEYLINEKKLNYTELSEQFGVSYDSVRRDVIELEDKGLLKKVHGGVVSNSYLNILAGQGSDVIKSKDLEVVIKKSVKLIQANQVILCDGGTTNFFMAELMPRNYPFTVITNSPPLAMALHQHENIDVLLLGGTYFKRYQISLGQETFNQLKGFRPDIYFMGINGIHATEGISIRNYEESLLKKAMIEVSTRVICPIITEKIGQIESYKICDIQEIDTLVCNLAPKAPILKDFNNLEIL
jgi:DeoR/GlpR family transcriptional regulator of sugar metabolism